MWERKVKTAKWNGVAFNIQQTTLDNGKRLHVVELPYADEPHIKVMGAKAKGINLEAVFVGVNSLVDANAFVAELESAPVGSLEHPYLGEMKLVYQSVSQSFSTKKGLVTLSLKFLKQGKDVVLTRAGFNDKPVSQLSDDVLDASTAQFVRDVEQASPEEVSSLQDDFNKVLNTLRSVANRATQGSMMLTRLHNQIQDGINSVNTIVNAPAAFAAHLKAVIHSLVKVLSDDDAALVVNAAASGVQLASGNVMSRGVSSRKTVPSVNQSASKMLGRCINPSSAFSHCNNQITVALVLLSEDLALVSSDDELILNSFIDNAVSNSVAGSGGNAAGNSVGNSAGSLSGNAADGSTGNTVGGSTGNVAGNLINSTINNSINKAALNIKVIRAHVDDRIGEATKSANYESLALVEALNALHESVIKQSNKIDKLLLSVKPIQIFNKRPLLCIAQSKECSAAEIAALNSIQHPLFVSGTLQVPNE